MLIDFHTHVFAEQIAERARDALIAGVYREQGADYRKGEQLNFRELTVSALLDSMEKSGVDKSVCLHIATKPHQTAAINAFAAESAAKTGGRILSFAAIHPDDPEWKATLDGIKAAGFPGIKLHPQFQLKPIDGEAFRNIIAYAVGLGLFVMFHAGADIGLPPPYFASPKQISRLLRSGIDGSRLIAAHMGGWQMWDDVERYLVGTDILFDTAFVRDFLPPEQAKRMIRDHGAEKILFGSDSPWEDPADTLQFLQTLGLTEQEMSLITHENAERLLALQ
ncbi:MAG: amidohydrolase family protein [Oscillospiraceae bacterium]|nr:amidohydrolase family protein [Oscillospiraceae bacterium]